MGIVVRFRFFSVVVEFIYKECGSEWVGQDQCWGVSQVIWVGYSFCFVEKGLAVRILGLVIQMLLFFLEVVVEMLWSICVQGGFFFLWKGQFFLLVLYIGWVCCGSLWWVFLVNSYLFIFGLLDFLEFQSLEISQVYNNFFRRDFGDLRRI